jgi:hypothetical protein
VLFLNCAFLEVEEVEIFLMRSTCLIVLQKKYWAIATTGRGVTSSVTERGCLSPQILHRMEKGSKSRTGFVAMTGLLIQ